MLQKLRGGLAGCRTKKTVGTPTFKQPLARLAQMPRTAQAILSFSATLRFAGPPVCGPLVVGVSPRPAPPAAVFLRTGRLMLERLLEMLGAAS
jgi:hypothetical protein